jgi:hypothetical protein
VRATSFWIRVRQKRRRQFSRHSGAAKDRQQLRRPKFIDFTPQLARSIVTHDAESARGIDEHFLMDIAKFDR